jgi:hypothetical protein
MGGDVVLSQRDVMMQGGSFVEGEPPVYEDETTADPESDTEPVDTTGEAGETTTEEAAVTTDASTQKTSGCKSALPTVGLLIPAVALLPAYLRKRRQSER